MNCSECESVRTCERKLNIPGMIGCSLGVKTPSRPMPDGYREIMNVDGVFLSSREIVITGIPDEDDENHDCDALGCSSVSHVLFRARIQKHDAVLRRLSMC